MFGANRYPRRLSRRLSIYDVPPCFSFEHTNFDLCAISDKPARHLLFIVRRALQRHGKILPPSRMINKRHRRLNVPVSTLECGIHNIYAVGGSNFTSSFPENCKNE